MPASPPSEKQLRSRLTVSPLIYPLDEFYARAQRSLPFVEMVPPDEVPEPFKSLLVHDQDMTPTLEAFHGGGVHLEVISREHRNDVYFREVVLHLDKTEQPVEFGAIRINLAQFPGPARREILEERMPLGHILAEHRVPHGSRPKAFLRLESDRFINQTLQLKRSQILYGRRNTLVEPNGHSIAEIVEILPPSTL